MTLTDLVLAGAGILAIAGYIPIHIAAHRQAVANDRRDRLRTKLVEFKLEIANALTPAFIKLTRTMEEFVTEWNGLVDTTVEFEETDQRIRNEIYAEVALRYPPDTDTLANTSIV